MADSGQFRSLDRRVDYGRPWRLGAPGRPTITLSFLFADVCPSSVGPHADRRPPDVRSAGETTVAPYLPTSRIGGKRRRIPLRPQQYLWMGGRSCLWQA